MADPILPDPIEIDEALATKTAHRLEVQAYTTPRFSDPADVSGKVGTVYVEDLANPTGPSLTYNVTWDDPSIGKGHITFGVSDHTQAGVAQAQFFLDGILKQRYLFEFVETLAP